MFQLFFCSLDHFHNDDDDDDDHDDDDEDDGDNNHPALELRCELLLLI